jgi:hypothetical protein
VTPARIPPARLLALGLAFVAIALVIAWPAIDGEFLSDDYLYIVNNPYAHGLSLDNVLAILHPFGPPTVYTLNYAPVHLLLHAAQWELVGEATRLYHVTNAVAHGLTSLLIVPFLLRAGVPATAAVLGALWFVVHPANVETVAWIFQLKTIVAVALSLGALLLHERRPATAAVLFALAMLTKVTAVGVLPVLVVQSWIRARREPAAPPRWGWVAAWLVVSVAIAVPEMAAFQRQADVRLVIADDAWAHGRTIFAIAARYLWMSATGLGVATFHEPPPAGSWLDPWWLVGLVAMIAIGARTLVTLLRGDEEAGLWVFAAAAFGPVSQIFPFVFPMGDRYLYPILPGLIGAVLLALRPAGSALAARIDARAQAGAASGGLAARLGVAAALGVCMGFAATSRERAPVFVSNMAMMSDAALRYPDGMQAHLLRGHRAGLEGNAEAAARAYDRAVDLGFSDLDALLTNPTLDSVRGSPDFRRVLEKLARLDIQRLGAHEHPEQSELIRLAIAYEQLGDRPAALAALERARTAPGGLGAEVERRIARLSRKAD